VMTIEYAFNDIGHTEITECLKTKTTAFVTEYKHHLYRYNTEVCSTI